MSAIQPEENSDGKGSSLKIITDFNDFIPEDMDYQNGLYRYTTDLPEGEYLYIFWDGLNYYLDAKNPDVDEFEGRVYNVRKVKKISGHVTGDSKTDSIKFENTRKYINPVEYGEIFLSIESDINDLEDINLISNGSILLKEKITAKDTVLYRFHVKCNTGILSYKFRITDGDTIDYGYGKHNDFFKFDFNSPAITYLNIPDWSRGDTVYQIFPERFSNGDYSNDKEYYLPWYGDNGNYSLSELSGGFFGGDIAGINNHLDYLKELDVGCIYLNPIFQAPSTHKYDTSDYLEIDPSFGDETDLKDLIDDSHEKDIKIILDGVFNHSGTEFFAMKSNFEYQENSEYLDWYHILKFPIKKENGYYENWFGYASLPKFNHDCIQVRGYLASVIGKWFSFGVDGWRLDTVDQFTYSFLSDYLYPVIKSISENSIVVGEYWKDASIYFEKNCMNGVMNYLFRDAAISFAKGGTARTFTNNVNEYLNEYPPQILDGLWNMLGSHDTERILTILNENTDALKTAVALQMTFKGSPVIYYGDEIGMTGEDDPGCRKPFIWNEDEQNVEIKDFYGKLAKIRSENSCLKKGEIEFLPSKNSVLIFRRFDENGELKVILNSRTRSVKLSEEALKNLQGNYIDLLTGNKIEIKEEIPGRQILILKEF